MKTQVYAQQAGELSISVQTEDGTEVQSMKQEVVKGVNALEYDASISDKGRKALKKKEVAVKQADNDQYYLPKGTYKMVVSLGGQTASQSFEVK